MAFTPLGIFVALIFIGLPFVVRTVQPVLEDLEAELEEAAATLGASRWHHLRRVILPVILPALLTGFALAFARAVGEYGSVIFIAGNLPNVSEIAPLLIVIRLEEFRYADATAIAVVMLLASFLLLLAINRAAALVGSCAPETAVSDRAAVRSCTVARSDAERAPARARTHAGRCARRPGAGALDRHRRSRSRFLDLFVVVAAGHRLRSRPSSKRHRALSGGARRIPTRSPRSS